MMRFDYGALLFAGVFSVFTIGLIVCLYAWLYKELYYLIVIKIKEKKVFVWLILLASILWVSPMFILLFNFFARRSRKKTLRESLDIKN